METIIFVGLDVHKKTIAVATLIQYTLLIGLRKYL